MREAIFNLMTPSYIVNKGKFSDNLDYVRCCFLKAWGSEPVLGYSVKTNHLSWLMTVAKNNGMLAEVVSDDEYNLALSCGFLPNEIIFNGPQKSSEKLVDALSAGSLVNLDNWSEIDIIRKSRDRLKKADLKVGIRVNFDLEKCCPGETTAGDEVSRFGFCVENGDLAEAVKVLRETGITVSGLHMHYSSKTRSIAVFKNLSYAASRLVEGLNLNDTIEYIDIGGGLFLGHDIHTPGKPSMEEYASAICDTLKKSLEPKKVKLIIEPGAALVATPVDYLCTVLNVRDVRGVKIITVDGSLLHINPFMAKRNQPADVVYLNDVDRSNVKEQIVCGATCMENDRMLYLKNEKNLIAGDKILFRSAGAYTMGFNSAFINNPPAVYKKESGRYQLIRSKIADAMKNF